MLGNIRIGNHVKVGAGSVVIHPVPDNSTVVGVPAEIVRREGHKVLSQILDHGDLPDPVKALKNRIRALQKEIESLEGQMQNQQKSQKSNPT